MKRLECFAVLLGLGTLLPTAAPISSQTSGQGTPSELAKATQLSLRPTTTMASPYRLIENWPTIPDDQEWGAAIGPTSDDDMKAAILAALTEPSGREAMLARCGCGAEVGERHSPTCHATTRAAPHLNSGERRAMAKPIDGWACSCGWELGIRLNAERAVECGQCGLTVAFAGPGEGKGET